MGEIRPLLATIRHEREKVPAETNTFRRHHEDTIRLDDFRAKLAFRQPAKRAMVVPR